MSLPNPLFVDAYFWYRGIGCDNKKASELAHKELTMTSKEV